MFSWKKAENLSTQNLFLIEGIARLVNSALQLNFQKAFVEELVYVIYKNMHLLIPNSQDSIIRAL